MKFTDLDKTLVTEAPEGKFARAATAVKKNIGPTKKIRQRAAGQQSVQKQALDIKGKFHTWAGENNKGSSVEDFKAFAAENYPELASVIDIVAAKLKFAKKPAPDKSQPDDSSDQQAEQPSSGEESEEMISPEEMTGDGDGEREPGDPTKKPADMGQEEYDSIKSEYAKKFADDTEESVEEDSDDAEPKVDMSASIYEARFNHMLLLERDLKDNQLDTLIVRALQAAGKQKSSTDNNEPEPESPRDRVAARVKASKEKKTGWPEPKSGGEESLVLGNRGDGGVLEEYGDELEDILKTAISKKELSSNQIGYAKAILSEIQ